MPIVTLCDQPQVDEILYVFAEHLIGVDIVPLRDVRATGAGVHPVREFAFREMLEQVSAKIDITRISTHTDREWRREEIPTRQHSQGYTYRRTESTAKQGTSVVAIFRIENGELHVLAGILRPDIHTPTSIRINFLDVVLRIDVYLHG